MAGRQYQVASLSGSNQQARNDIGGRCLPVCFWELFGLQDVFLVPSTQAIYTRCARAVLMGYITARSPPNAKHHSLRSFNKEVLNARKDSRLFYRITAFAAFSIKQARDGRDLLP